MFAAAGTVQVLPCVLLSSGIDSVQLVWLCSLCVAMDLFMTLQVRVCLVCLRWWLRSRVLVGSEVDVRFVVEANKCFITAS